MCLDSLSRWWSAGQRRPERGEEVGGGEGESEEDGRRKRMEICVEERWVRVVGGEGLDREPGAGRGCAWAGWIAGRGLEGGSSAPRTWQGAMAQGPTDVPMCASARLVRVRCSPSILYAEFGA